MKKHNALHAIAALDLTPIKTKLMHTASGEGWSQAKADAMELEYRRFLYLMHTFPNEQAAPTNDVDTFWHYHILDTKKYAADCEQAFGYFMHHYPYVGLETDAEAGTQERGGDRMQQLYEATFGEAYIRPEAYGVAATGASAAFCMCEPGGTQPPATGLQGASAAFCMMAESPLGARSAFCMMAEKPVGAQAAFCMMAEKPAGAQAAFCMMTEKPTGAQAAFCMMAEKPAGAQAAFCMMAEKPAGANAAFCMMAEKPLGAQAAFCMMAEKPLGAQAAFCMMAEKPLGAQAAFCMMAETPARAATAVQAA